MIGYFKRNIMTPYKITEEIFQVGGGRLTSSEDAAIYLIRSAAVVTVTSVPPAPPVVPPASNCPAAPSYAAKPLKEKSGAAKLDTTQTRPVIKIVLRFIAYLQTYFPRLLRFFVYHVTATSTVTLCKL